MIPLGNELATRGVEGTREVDLLEHHSPGEVPRRGVEIENFHAAIMSFNAGVDLRDKIDVRV